MNKAPDTTQTAELARTTVDTQDDYSVINATMMFIKVAIVAWLVAYWSSSSFASAESNLSWIDKIEAARSNK